MYITRGADGRNNICGAKISLLRREYPTKLSQRALADKLQLEGFDCNKNIIQRIESGKRFVTDIELGIIAKFFNVSCDYLISEEN